MLVYTLEWCQILAQMKQNIYELDKLETYIFIGCSEQIQV